MNHFIITLVAASILIIPAGCATTVARQGEWLSYDQVRRSLRRKIGMRPGEYVQACGPLINAGQLTTGAQLSGEEAAIVIADGASNFYSRWSGELVVECGYWSCVRQPKICNRHCPPRGWNCGWEMP
jgi:hypothetical protein